MFGGIRLNKLQSGGLFKHLRQLPWQYVTVFEKRTICQICLHESKFVDSNFVYLFICGFIIRRTSIRRFQNCAKHQSVISISGRVCDSVMPKADCCTDDTISEFNKGG